MRPEALDALAEVEMIVHAGDVGLTRTVLDALARIAPVKAIRGNVDRGALAAQLPETAEVQAGSIRIYVLHDLNQLAIDPASARLPDGAAAATLISP